MALSRAAAVALLAIGMCSATGDDGFKLVMLDAPSESLAMCLDGSRGGFYHRVGSPDLWILEMEGGGWCTSLTDCSQRAKTDIGTSKNWAPTGCPGMDGGSNGMLSASCAVNPHFCNATGIHLNYCDGASFASSSAAMPVVGDVTLHFRGADIFNATFNRLLALGMGAAKEVILKGCSAGGLAVYLHCDLFAAMLRAAGSAARVVCMPDAGFFRMDYDTVAGAPHYTPEQQWVFEAQGVVQMDAGCVAAHAGSNDTWRCFFAEANLPFITTPLFVTQDLVDSWQMANVLALPCGMDANGKDPCNATYLAAVQKFRDSMVTAYAPLVGSSTNGGFLSTCYQHCHQNLQNAFTREQVQGQTVQDTFWNWWSGAPNKTMKTLVIDGDWRSNAFCTDSPYCEQ